MVILLSRLLCALPLGAALALARLLARVWYHVIPIRLGVARANLRRVFPERKEPERERILLRSLENLCMSMVEALRAPRLTPALAAELVACDLGPLEAGRAAGRGVIGVSAHLGSFESGVCSVAVRGMPLTVVVREIAWGPAQRFITLVRRRTGMKLLAPRRTKEQIREALARNEVVTLVVDQHMPKHRAIVCELFGQLAATSPAPARFALETGAPIVVGVMRRSADRRTNRLLLEPFAIETPHAERDANIRHNTERLNRLIEGWVRDNPEEWLWLHKRFKVQDAPEGWDIPAHLQHLLPKRS